MHRKDWNFLVVTVLCQKNCIPEPENNNNYVNELNELYARFDDKDFQNECNNIIMNLVSSKEDVETAISREEIVK